jgi:hypothetical protein
MDKDILRIECRFWRKAKIAEQEFVYANRQHFQPNKLNSAERELFYRLAELFYAPKREGF